MRRHLPVLVLLLVFLAIGSLYAVLTPPWQAPDEPAHYNYVRQLARGELPVIEPGDYDQEYQGEVISSRFDPQYTVEPFSYEDWQPPLYYLLLTPLFLLLDGALLPLRLASVVIGSGVVLLAYLVARQVWPGRDPAARALSLTTAAFVAFLPQHVAMLAAVNNDGLAELLIALLLWLLLRPATYEQRRPSLCIGLLLGLGFLTKATVYIMVPVVALALLYRFRAHWPALAVQGLRVALPAALLGAIWWGRNLLVYDGLDPLATAAHDAVVVGQPRTVEWLALYGPADVAVRFVRTTFQSFWGQFGWMAVPMPWWVYGPLLVFSLVVLLGLGWMAVSGRRLTVNSERERVSVSCLPLLVLGTTFLFTLLLYVGYNLAYVQHQGRYLFPALVPIGVAVAAGLAAVVRPFTHHRPALLYLLPAGLALALLALDLIALFRFIIPCLSIGGGC